MPKVVVIFRKEPDAPDCLLASIGGTAEEGYFCTFRGEQADVAEMLRAIYSALHKAPSLAIGIDGIATEK